MQMKRLLALSTLALSYVLSASAVLAQQTAMPGHSGDGHVMVAPDEIKWQVIPREWTNGPPPPPGTSAPPEVAIIWGDPAKEGAPFMFRLRSSTRGANVPIPPHTHPTDERITVISGVFCLGAGKKFDEAACKDLPAGSYMVMPAGVPHFAVGKDSIIEVYGIGPFKLLWVRE
jgi:hypothetical protein